MKSKESVNRKVSFDSVYSLISEKLKFHFLRHAYVFKNWSYVKLNFFLSHYTLYINYEYLCKNEFLL